MASTTEGRWSAPGRVNLIGEHTDYNGGLVLPFAIAERTTAAIANTRNAPQPGLWLTSDSVDGGQVSLTVGQIAPQTVGGWEAYVAGAVWALGLAPRLETDRIEIGLTSNVPVASGLSSSAALLCSVALGLNDLFDLGNDRNALADATQRAENDFVGAPTGGMDQRASLLGTAGHALLYNVLADRTELVPFDPGGAGLSLLAVDTRVSHSNVDGAYGQRRADCEEAAAALGVALLGQLTVAEFEAGRDRIESERAYRRARHVVTENERVRAVCAALAADDWERVGVLMTEAHTSIRDDFEASCPELDTAAEALLAAGALGARMTGGGFGGAVIGLVPTPEIDRFASAAGTAFADAGFGPPNCFLVAPSAGAQREP